MDKRRTKKKIVSVKYYTRYEILKFDRLYRNLPEGQYRIVTNYFMFKGNILSDSMLLKTEEVIVNSDCLEQKENSLNKKIDKTKKAFLVELRSIGASPLNTFRIMKQKGFTK